MQEERTVICEERTVTYAELSSRAGRAATGFAKMGIAAGDSVALLMRNDIAFLEAQLGAARLGAYCVPVNWHFKGEEIRYQLEDSGARLLVAHADLFAAAADFIPDIPVLLVDPSPGTTFAASICGGRRQCWDDWLEDFPEWQGPRVPAPDSMVYTSGTTGKPKGVRRRIPDPEQAAGMDHLRRMLFGMSASSRSLVTGPMYHSAPSNFASQAVAHGQLTVLMTRFDPEEMLRLVERHRITTMFMVPTMFVRLLNLPEEVRRRYDLSSLEFIVHSAAPCPPEVKKAMIGWWGPILYEFYGSSESGPIAFVNSEDWLSKTGTVGKILPGATVKVYKNDGSEAGMNEPGELFVRQRFTPDFAYHRLPEKRIEVERDGLITSGDVGYVDADNYLYLCDRVRDMVISGGVNIYPAEIEGVLINAPGVKECAVFGVPDAEYGESLMAFVEPLPGSELDTDMLRTYLEERIARYKVPRRIELKTDLPRDDSGKIYKRRLREPYWANAQRNI